MRSQENLYKELKDKMSGFEKQPPDQVWNNIEEQLNKGKSSPWIPILFISTLLLVIGGLAIYFAGFNETSDSAIEGFKLTQMSERTQETTSDSKIQTQIPEEITSHATYAVGEDEELSQEFSKSNLPLSSERNVTVDEVEDNTVHSSSHIAQYEETSLEKISEEQEMWIEENTRNINIAESPVSDYPLNHHKESDIDNSAVHHDDNSTAFTRIPSKKQVESWAMDARDDIKHSPDNELYNRDLNVVDGGFLSTMDLSEEESRIAGADFVVLKQLDHIPPHISESQYSTLNQNILPLHEIPHLLNRKSWFRSNFRPFAEAKIGLGVGVRELSLKDNFHSELIHNKQELESAQHNESYGFQLGLLWNKGVSISSGLEVFKQYEKYRYVDNFAIIDKPLIVYDTIYYNGEQIIRPDTISDYTIGKHTYQHYNSIRTIDIPIIVGYEIPIRNWVISTRAGMYFNIRQQMKGMVAGMDKTPVTIDSESAPYNYKTHIGLGYYGELGVAYIISPSWEIGINPRLRYNPHSIIEDGSVLSQKYTQFNISISLRKFF